MKSIYRALLLAIALSCQLIVSSQEFSYNDSWSANGINLEKAGQQGLLIAYSIQEFSLGDIEINGEMMKKVHLPGHFLPNDEGAPDIPGSGHFIALPEGATPVLNIIDIREEIIKGVDISPAPRLPKDTDRGPLEYNKDPEIYSRDAYYPARAVNISDVRQIRGVDAAILGITPFQYNPVRKELKVIRDIIVEVTFEGGNGQFGEDRLRSRWFDPILKDMFINYDVLPEKEYTSHQQATRDEGCEYVIISPDDPDFLAWADSLKLFRNMQGISTEIYTTTQIGGNGVAEVEGFIDNAYNTWTIPPVAVLIFADYGNGSTEIMAPIWEGYCASDHIYADVDGDDMEDIILARITAQNSTHLENMIGKVLEHERTPPADFGFYDHPITALGWQTERWFQICSESIGGYFKHVQGKNPVRINEIYEGNPAVDPWSTATNTYTVLNTFGPNGLGYIPASPAALGGWSGGNATMINNAINDGAFILQHRDHGYEQGWGEPSYSSSNINGLTNEEYCFVFSVNCLTGKYNHYTEVFTEKFHRSEYGALGVIAASEVSYSFVNDTYVWGLYDHLWQDFLPDDETAIDHRGLLPAFGNAAAKYFLEQSNWPYNSGGKEVTYNLFHHHGCAFSTLYSEVPQDLLVVHDNVLVGGVGSFTVQADSGAFIALSVNGEIIGTAEATGLPVVITIPPQMPGDTMDVVITKTNYLRYHAGVEVISPDIPYVVYEAHDINDETGNDNGMMDYAESILLSVTVENVGNIDAENVSATIRTNDPYVIISDSTEYYGSIPAHQTSMIEDGYAFDVTQDLPDGHHVLFELESTDGDSIWMSNFVIIGHAPVIVFEDFYVDDPTGNANGRIDPGETVDINISIMNAGSSAAYNVFGELTSEDDLITINSGSIAYGQVDPDSSIYQSYSVTADPTTPGGFNANFDFEMVADLGIGALDSFDLTVGQYAALILDLDENHYSGPAFQAAFDETELLAHYTNSFPEDLSDYKSIFMCLGIIFTGHQLTESEALLLVDYLENGGKLYLEGRRTWHDDPQTSLHPMFNIDVVQDTWFEYDTIYGMAETFTEGMIFGVDGYSPYNDYYMEPVSPAFTILESPETGYGCAVAYDEGTYKTIGASNEFGFLVDGEPPSTKKQLLFEMLDFFGSFATGVEERPEKDAGTISSYPNPFADQTTISFTLDRPAHARLEIFSLNGQRVNQLIDMELPEGTHRYQWDGKNNGGIRLTSGIYFCKLTTNNLVITHKIVLIE